MKRFLLLALLALPAFAARTTVTGTMQLANGSFCSGTLSISNPPFTNTDGFFAGGTFTTPINAATGSFSVSLEPGPYYTVTYVTAPSGCAPPTEFWSVPVSATPVDIAVVRTTTPPPPLPNTLPLSGLQQSGATTGQCAAWNGTNWAPAACSSTSGTVTSVGLVGTSNQITVTGASPITGAGTWTLSLPSSLVLPSGTTGTTQAPSDNSTKIATTAYVDNAAGCPTCVTAASTLTSTAIMTGAGSRGAQTPSATATLSSGGNISTPGTIAAGVGGGAAGAIELTQGTAFSLGTTSVGIYAPTSVTSYAFLLPSAAATGLLHATNAANIDTLSISSVVSADLNITTTTCTNQFLTAISATGTGTCTTDTLASAQHANQGTTTTVLHGNGAGNPSWAAVVSADLNITTSTCTNQFLTAISATGTGTCTTATLASAQFANQGTTTTVLHGNAAGNPSFGQVAISTDVSGLGTGVATALGTAVSGTGAICLASGSACSGGATNITVGSSTITSGTDTRILYDNSGVLGEYTISGTGTTIPTTTGPTFTGAITAGTDNSAAGTLQLANGSAAAHTIFGSGATTTNTINGFATVPTTGHLLDCTVSSTTCLLHDSGVVTANVVNASSPGVGIAHFAGSTQTVTSSLIVAADITSATITGTQIASSIALAGSPTTTTQSVGDNSTKIATTAYADASGGHKLFDSTLSMDTASIDTGAAGIAGGYDVLQIWIIVRTDEAVVTSNMSVTFNNDTGANYDRQFVRGNNVTASAATGNAATAVTIAVAGASTASGVASTVRMTIPGYTQTTFNKSGEFTDGIPDPTAANTRVDAQAFQWRNTAAITRMAITPVTGGAKLKAGSRLLIFGY